MFFSSDASIFKKTKTSLTLNLSCKKHFHLILLYYIHNVLHTEHYYEFLVWELSIVMMQTIRFQSAYKRNLLLIRSVELHKGLSSTTSGQRCADSESRFGDSLNGSYYCEKCESDKSRSFL